MSNSSSVISEQLVFNEDMAAYKKEKQPLP